MSQIIDALTIKGTRDYIQGVDLFDAALQAIQDVAGSPVTGPCKFKFEHKTLNAVELVLGDEAGQDSDGDQLAVFSVGIERDGESINGALIDTGQQIQTRVAFPEEQIFDAVAISGGRARLIECPAYRPMEILSSMNKHLHNTELPLPEGQIWIFTRIALDRPLTEDDMPTLELRLIDNLGNRLTRTEIHSATGRLGLIYFSAAPKASE